MERRMEKFAVVESGRYYNANHPSVVVARILELNGFGVKVRPNDNFDGNFDIYKTSDGMEILTKIAKDNGKHAWGIVNKESLKSKGYFNSFIPALKFENKALIAFQAKHIEATANSLAKHTLPAYRSILWCSEKIYVVTEKKITVAPFGLSIVEDYAASLTNLAQPKQ